MHFYPYLRRAVAVKDKLVGGKLRQAWDTFGSPSNECEGRVKCVVDLVVEKETALAKKHGREPDKESKILFDEVSAFISAGFESTSSSVGWGIKYLTKHQDVQHKLRRELQAAFQEAAQTGRQPGAEEIAKANIPYLDAFIDEVLRHSNIVPVNIRLATQDADVLGYHIPKGTDVFLLVCSQNSFMFAP